MKSISVYGLMDELNGQIAREPASPIVSEPGYWVSDILIDPLRAILGKDGENWVAEIEVVDGAYQLPPVDEWTPVEREWVPKEKSIHGAQFLKAVWSSAYQNDLPDSAFGYIEPDSGSKDGEGKTTPRSCRHFPYKDADGNVDLPHVQNALSRIPQSDVPDGVKDRLTAKFERILEENKSLAVPDLMVVDGGAIKDMGSGRVAGYLIRYGSPGDTDLEGEYFTKETDFAFTADRPRTNVFYDHGLDPFIGKKSLGIGILDAGKDDVGVWIEGQLALRDRYEEAVYELAKAGKMGWSSGTSPTLVEAAPVKNGARALTRWPLGLDASLTPIPAEPRNAVLTVKSYATMRPTLNDLLRGPVEGRGGAKAWTDSDMAFLAGYIRGAADTLSRR